MGELLDDLDSLSERKLVSILGDRHVHPKAPSRAQFIDQVEGKSACYFDLSTPLANGRTQLTHALQC